MSTPPPSPPHQQSRKLPMEIITNILSRLPIKPLLRFKLVSISFNSLISSPKFSTLHLSHSLSSSNRHIIISHLSLSISSFDFNTNNLTFSELTHHPLTHFPKTLPFQLIGTCNGILCISDYPKTSIFLYNPFTHSTPSLPPNTIHPPPSDPTHHSMLSSNHCFVFGFGYDSTRDDYKILSILQHLDDNEVITSTQATLCSLKSNRWKYVDVDNIFSFQALDALLVNEVLHFLILTEQQDPYFMCFDIKEETFSFLQLPDYVNNKEFDDYTLVMSEVDGCLTVVVNCHTTVKSATINSMLDVVMSRRLVCVDMWVMKEYGKVESWVKLFSIRNMIRIGIVCFAHVQAVAYSEDKERVLLELDNFNFIWYHLESGKFERVAVDGGPPDGKPFVACRCVVGSLVSVDRDGEENKSSGGGERRKIMKMKRMTKNKLGEGNAVGDLLSKGFNLRL